MKQPYLAQVWAEKSALIFSTFLPAPEIPCIYPNIQIHATGSIFIIKTYLFLNAPNNILYKL